MHINHIQYIIWAELKKIINGILYNVLDIGSDGGSKAKIIRNCRRSNTVTTR